MQKITTFLTFESRGKEAMDFYVSIFKNSKVTSAMVMPGDGTLLFASFVLDGQEFMAMDGGPDFTFEQGTSLFVTCEDQAEVDYFWDKLGDSGEHQQCGWLKDKFGVSWQVIPKALGELMSSADQDQSRRVREAMLKMTKIEIAGLQQAADRK